MTHQTSSFLEAGMQPRTMVPLLFRPWRFLVDALNHRKTCAVLLALDDHLLKDIGISRCEIERRCR